MTTPEDQMGEPSLEERIALPPEEKPKRTKAIILVGLVIAVAAAGVGYFFFIAGPSGGPGEGQPSAEHVYGLPLYPDATLSQDSLEDWVMLCEQVSVPVGVEGAVYESSASESDVLDWYRTQMLSEGWTKDSENAEVYGTSLTYRKGDNTAIILFFGGLGKFALMNGPSTAWGG